MRGVKKMALNRVNRIISYIRKWIYSNDNIIIFEHRFNHIQHSPSIIKYADYNNIADVLYFQPAKYLDTFRKFLKIGDIGYYAYLNGKCIHRSWVKHIAQDVYFHKYYKYKLSEDEAYIHYCETAEEAKGKNIYPHVLTRIVNDFSHKKRVLIVVDKSNISSIKGVTKAGFVEYLELNIIVILGVKIVKRIPK